LRKWIVDTLGCGFVLWLIGYVVSISLFPFMPIAIIGWPILVVLIPTTIWVSMRRFKNSRMSFTYYLLVGIVWLLIAFSFDYLFIIEAFKVANYYDFDVSIYYGLTFFIPFVIGIKYGRK
jgi:hypothetical protein